LTPACVNKGGPASLIRLGSVPRLEAETLLPPQAVAALSLWESRPGDVVTVIDPQQNCYRARIVEFGSERAVAVPFHQFPGPVESMVSIEVYQALPEKERFELILQKLTEIGVSRIVPYISTRSTTLEERDAGQKKSHRWPDVILRAAKQCRRGMIPELFAVASWDEATYRAAGADLKLMLCESGASWSMGEALRGENPGRVALLIGPEGGFDSAEVEDAWKMGFLPVSLGPRILRTESAAIVGAAIVQYELGDIG
jgi:16S rRNA (uracil1498-N3)-methyltransferase